LPQAAETKIVVTMNCRELIHFSSALLHPRPVGDKEAGNKMLKICKENCRKFLSQLAPSVMIWAIA